MANNLNTNPMTIDTFGSDVSISTGPIKIKSVIVEGATAGDTCTFIDGDGNLALRLSVDIGTATIDWSPPGGHWFDKGLVFDDSASDLAANDFVLIFVE